MKEYFQNRNIEIIEDEDGKIIVKINDIKFQGKRKIRWKDVNEYLRRFISESFVIDETSEKIFIGTDFPDEYSWSIDTKRLMGTLAKAKANGAQAIPELIQIASNKGAKNDYHNKHGNKAKYGWYRYDSRFALPVFSNDENIERYNIFKVKMLVRHDADGKKYLYDMVNIKKETSKPLDE